MECKVYKITNLINGKIYVGITKEKYLKHRFWAHTNRQSAAGSYIHKSIQKYGAEHFLMELLATYHTPDEAKAEERRLISIWRLNVHRYPEGNGMNLTDGGDGSYGCRHSTSSIKKMSGKNNHNYGLLGSSNPTSKAVEQYTLNGTYIQTYGSMHEAARCLKPGCSKRQQSSVASNILTVIKGTGRSKQAYGYRWMYATSTPLAVV